MPAKKNTEPAPTNVLASLLGAAESVITARRDQMLTATEWHALASAVAAGRRLVPAAPAPTEPDEMLATLKVTKQERSRLNGGTWVEGTIAGHTFHALVFPEHAERATYELGQSRISKLWVREQVTRRDVAAFDRGWDQHPTTAAALAIVDLLAAGLAETVFTK